ncbi:MAG: hypothetical protein ACK4MG_00390 [Aquabacterium sp.]
MDTPELNPTEPTAMPSEFAETAIRTAEQICQMNVAATSVMLQAQAQTASALGMPDWSQVIAAGSEQTRQVLSAGTEQLVQAAQQTEAVVGELQRNASQLMEDQTSRASQLIQDGMAELSQQTREHLGRVDDWQGQALDSATSGVTAIQDWGRMTADAMDQLPRPDLRLAALPQAVQGVLPAGPM